MIWTASNNGKKHPSRTGYRFKISAGDRDRTFMTAWRQITIELPTQSGAVLVKVNVGKDSFWRDCRELISDAIGRWLLDQGFPPWLQGRQPKFDVELTEAGAFRVKGPIRVG